jgi:hypothetical protein
MVEACSMYGEKRTAYTYRVLFGKSEGKRPLRRIKRKENNIKMDL